MSAGSFFLHVGLPRTATTILQREVFPKLQGITYLGKPWDNSGIMKGEINPSQLLDQWVQNPDTHSADYKSLMGVMPTLVKVIKNNNQLERHQQAIEHVKVLGRFINGLRGKLPDHTFLYSDESLIESVAGLSSNNQHGATVPLEQLASAGLLKDITVLLVLREPEAFLRASWYKNNEFQHKYGLQPYSFDTWVKKQLALLVRKRSASRIFQALHKSFSRHVKAHCPDLHISHYEALKQSDDVMGSLTGGRLFSPGISLKSLPKENSSFRNQEVVDFMLSAPGVPKGIDLNSYVQTFKATLQHYEIWDTLKSERLHETQTLKS
jgi:hypothetical protein